MKLLYLENLEVFAYKIAEKITELFVLKEDGKGLSSNDYTTEDKNKVKNIPTDYIISGSQTSISTDDSGTNIYTFVSSGGQTSTFIVKNGSKGSKGATGAAGANGMRGSRWNHGTKVTGTSATAAVFSGTGITDALVNDYYLNTSTGNVYRCTASGNASIARWVYVGNIKGTPGEMGDVDEITETDINGIIAGTYSE